jgi:hypothetical protein
MKLLLYEDNLRRDTYLVEWRCHDGAFYDPTTYRPLRADQRDPELQDILPWLKNDVTHLTIAEFEIALMLFRWESREAELSAWAQCWPKAVQLSHDFFLRHYTFPLVRARKSAVKKMVCTRTQSNVSGNPTNTVKPLAGVEPPLKEEKRSSPLPDPAMYSVGFRADWFLRLGALIALGYVALMSTNVLGALFFAASWWIVLPWTVAMAVGLVLFYQVDVFKQNRALAWNTKQLLPRTRRLAGWGILYTTALGVCVAFFLLIAVSRWSNADRLWTPDGGNPLSDLIVPRITFAWPPDWPTTLDMTLRWISFGLTANFIGLLIQWIWEDRSAVEPL